MVRPPEIAVPTLFDVLTGCANWWATPGTYASLRTLRFAPDGTGTVLYGYGQTIYAKIDCRFTITEPDGVELANTWNHLPIKCSGGSGPTAATAARWCGLFARPPESSCSPRL